MYGTCCLGIGFAAGAKLIATFDIFLAFVQLGYTIFAFQITTVLTEYVEHKSMHEYDDFTRAVLQFSHGDSSSWVLGLIVVLVGITTLDVAASCCLLYGSNTLNPVYCRRWMRFRLFLLGTYIIYFFVELNRSHLFVYGIFHILNIFYRIWTLSTIAVFTHELENEAAAREYLWNRVLTPNYNPVQPEESASYQFSRWTPLSPASPLIYQRPPAYHPIPTSGQPSYIHTNTYGTTFNGIPPSLPSLY